jgi:uncharacterized repeat protein (TIGR01451 family)
MSRTDPIIHIKLQMRPIVGYSFVDAVQQRAGSGLPFTHCLFTIQVMKSLLNFVVFATGLLLGQVTFAQSQVSSTLLAQRVDVVDGKAVLKPAMQSKPGEVIDYSSTYKNSGTAAAEKLVATVPVPVGTTLIAGSAEPAQALASTDGTVFAAMPLMRTVRQADGSQRSEAVPLADYRALRWDLGTLAAGRATVVSLRTRIDSPVAAAPAARPSSRP